MPESNTTSTHITRAQNHRGAGREAPPFLRTDALMYWDELAALFVADRLYDYRLARYCNMLARLAELEGLMSRGGVMSSTYPLLGDDGRANGVREWPQAAEYRALQHLLLAYERDLAEARH